MAGESGVGTRAGAGPGLKGQGKDSGFIREHRKPPEGLNLGGGVICIFQKIPWGTSLVIQWLRF